MQKVFSKIIAQNNRQEKVKLEKDLKLLEKDLNTLEDIENHNVLKNRLENIYKHITKGIKIRSRCQWYEDGEKFTKFFLNLEKARDRNSTIKMLENNGEELID